MLKPPPLVAAAAAAGGCSHAEGSVSVSGVVPKFTATQDEDGSSTANREKKANRNMSEDDLVGVMHRARKENAHVAQHKVVLEGSHKHAFRNAFK